MKLDDFHRIVEAEGLGHCLIGTDEGATGGTEVTGYVYRDGKWLVYETDDRATFYVISSHETEADALDALLDELRGKKLVALDYESFKRRKRGE